MNNGDWGLGIGDWGLGIGPNPQAPIPHPHLLLIYDLFIIILIFNIQKFNILKINDNLMFYYI